METKRAVGVLGSVDRQNRRVMLGRTFPRSLALSGVTKQEAAMSWNPSLEPGCPDAVGVDAIETLIVPRARESAQAPY
jgi:hypothetical protein